MLTLAVIFIIGMAIFGMSFSDVLSVVVYFVVGSMTLGVLVWIGGKIRKLYK